MSIKYPDNDEDRMECLLKYFFTGKNSLEPAPIRRITADWEELTQAQSDHLETLLAFSGLFIPMLKLTPPYYRIKEDAFIEIKNAGSYKKYMESKKIELLGEHIDKTAARKKLWYESENARLVFEDYPRLKSNQKWMLIAAIASVVISAIAIAVSMTKK